MDIDLLDNNIIKLMDEIKKMQQREKEFVSSQWIKLTQFNDKYYIDTYSKVLFLPPKYDIVGYLDTDSNIVLWSI